MTPEFRVLADGLDVTLALLDRLVSLTITDDEGVEADRLDMVVDDRDGVLALPPHGAALEVYLGFRERGLSYMGRYVVDKTEGSGPPALLQIGAKAANMGSQIRAPRTRGWTDITLGDIASRVAQEAGLRPVIGASIADTRYPFVAQTAESDLHLLTRLARVLDATAKPAAGTLLVVKRGEGLTAAGQQIIPQPILASELTGWQWDIRDRVRYGAVAAQWTDVDGASLVTETAGDAEPKLTIRHVYSSQDEARRAAGAALQGAQRGEGTLSLSLGRFAPDVFAGGLIDASDLREELRGEWHVTRVEHVLDAGLLTNLEAQRKQA